MPVSKLPISLSFVLLAAVLFIGCGGDGEADDAEGSESARAEEAAKSEAAESTRDAQGLYKIKSGKIVYKYTGSYDGEATLYVDDYGNTVVLDMNRTWKGTPEHKTIIWKDGESTVYDHTQKTIWNSRIRIRETEPTPLADISEQDIERIGYVRKENEQVAGKECTVYHHEKNGIGYWLWNGIDLKEHNRPDDGGYIKEAVTVEEGSAIPEDLLAEPAGYTRQ